MKNSQTTKAKKFLPNIPIEKKIHHRRLARIIGYSGAIIQAIIITNTYLQFKVATKVDISTPRQTQLPSVSLCFFFKFNDLHIEITPDYYGVASKTLSEMNELIPTWDEFVSICEVLGPDYKYEHCLSMDSSIVEYMSLYSKCFSLFRNVTSKVSYERKKVGDNFIFHAVLNTSLVKTNTIGIFLTDPTTDLDESLGHPGFVQFDSFENNRATVAYRRTIIKSMPSPYVTNCFDYEKLPCKNRKTCIKRCIVEASYEAKKTWVNRRYIEVRDAHLDGRFANHSEANVSKGCYAKFSRQPCYEEIYEAILATQFLSPFRNNDTYHIAVAYPYGIEKIVEYVPAETFTAYFVYVTSIIGIWTQISIIGISNYLLTRIVNFFKHQTDQITQFNGDEQVDKQNKRGKNLISARNCKVEPKVSLINY